MPVLLRNLLKHKNMLLVVVFLTLIVVQQVQAGGSLVNAAFRLQKRLYNSVQAPSQHGSNAEMCFRVLQ